MALSMDQIYEEILRDGGETPSKKVRAVSYTHLRAHET